MLKYRLYQDNRSNSLYPGKWYARAVVNETIDLDGLAAHMAAHNSPFSKGAIKGILTDMVTCIKELVLQGVAVKIEDLAIFSLGISCKPADSAKDFDAKLNVEAFHLRARATGQFSRTELKSVASITELDFYNVSKEDSTAKDTNTGE